MEIRDDMSHKNNENDDNQIPVTSEDRDKVTRKEKDDKGDKQLLDKIIEGKYVLSKKI